MTGSGMAWGLLLPRCCWPMQPPHAHSVGRLRERKVAPGLKPCTRESASPPDRRGSTPAACGGLSSVIHRTTPATTLSCGYGNTVIELCCLHLKHLARTVLTDHNTDIAMASGRAPSPGPDQPMICHIRIEGHLGPHWSSWFEGLAIMLEDNGETLLTGPLVDQAALHGLIRKLRDLCIPLLSVVCGEADQAETAEGRDGQ